MAPASSSRHVWLWSGALAFLLSFVWYSRKRNSPRSDPGGTPQSSTPDKVDNSEEHEVQEECTVSSSTALEKCVAPTSVTVDEGAPSSSVVVQESAPSASVSPGECSLSASAACEPAPDSPAIVGSDSEQEPDSTIGDAQDIEKDLAEVVQEVSAVEEETENSVQGVKEMIVEEAVQSKIASVSESAVKVDQCKALTSEAVSESAAGKCQLKEFTSSNTMKDSKEEVEVPATKPPQDKIQEVKVDALEGKLASLALGSNEEQRGGADRDSANHSPADAMLASPSMSSYSDEHSEGSSDSGKGCSDVASPPSRTPVGSGSLAGDADSYAGVEASHSFTIYEFLLPQILVGRLIGRQGCYVQEIKSKTNAHIWIKKHPESSKQKICSIEGTSADIDSALAMIRERFPLRKYPNVTLEQVSFLPAACTFPLVPDFCQLHLVEGVNNEVMISSLVSPAHMFLQQPYHPTYQFLQRLNHMMNSVYAHVETPNLPDPIEAGNICVAPAIDGWYRAQVVSTNEESQTSEIKFVDYGGYMTVNNSILRQIRQDFMTLPFQAVECYLANIKPTGETGEWSLEALRIVEELTRGQMLLAQVYDYAADGAPIIYLYSSVNSQPWMYNPEVVLINQDLVARGLADLDETVTPGNSAEAASLVVAAAEVKAAAAAAAAAATAAAAVNDISSSPSESGEDKSLTLESNSTPEVTAS